MKFKIRGNCNKGECHDGLLYCAQRIEEMLMPYTSHLYKTPIYNTFLLAYEFMKVNNYVNEKSIDSAHLKNVLEEFINTFKEDIVIKTHFSDSQRLYFIGRLEGGSASDQIGTINYLIQIMGEYPKWCANVLRESIDKPKEKKKIEKALRSYIPMIIGMGYHPYHIYHVCKNTFVCKDVCSTVDIDAFLERFNGEEKNYTVYFLADKNIIKFQQILTGRLGMSFVHDQFSDKLHCDYDKQTCICISNTALDPNKAAHTAFMTFDFFMRYYRYLGNRDREWLGEKCIVVDEEGSEVYPHFGLDRCFYPKDFDDKTLGKNSEIVITQLMESAGGKDIYVIDKIIRAHNMAISCVDIKNTFLNLWSIIEIIGVGKNREDTSKIRQIISNIIPILKRNYLKNIVEEMHDYLKGNLETTEYNELIGDVKEEGTEVYRLAFILTLKEYDVTRKKAYNMLEKYPLIRSRISQLYDDIFRKRKNYLNELHRYEKRITWHIQRLYRVRNSIIHSGESNENMVALVEHLHSYIDEVINDIIKRITGDNSLGTVDNVLLDARIFNDNLEKRFEDEDGLTYEDVVLLLQ